MLRFLLRHKFLLLIVAIQSIVTCLYAANLSNIKYAFVGDEYYMYQYARNIITGYEVPNPFALNGVFGTNPALGSYYQAAVMMLFGVHIYGWKLSSLIIIFPLGLLMFYLVKRIGTLQAAFFALIATDVSFYLYNFFQIGYLNNLSLLCLVLLMYLLTYVPEKETRQSYKYYVLLGAVTGLSWYFYIGKLFIVIVGLYLLFVKKLQRKFLPYFFVFLGTSLLLIGISFLATPKKTADLGLSKTLLHKEFTDNAIILRNIFYPFILHHYSPAQTHYLPRASYTDPLTASLATGGFFMMLLSISRKRFRLYPGFHRFLLLFLLVSLCMGITSPYALPPVTRGIHYVPFYILFAAYCLAYLAFLLRDKKHQATVMYILLTTIVVCLNLITIAAPLKQNTTQKLITTLKKEPYSQIYFLKNNYCYNFALLDTLLDGFLLSYNVIITDKIDSSLCKQNNVIVTCSVKVCKSNPTSIIDNNIYYYRQ